MGTRGRISAASLAIVQPGERAERPPPPVELTQEQRQEWLTVVNRLPAEWFQPETYALLAQYCRHVVSARRVAQLIDALESDSENFDTDQYDQLLKMQEREGRALSSLATRMRITQQSTYDPRTKKPQQQARPWDK